MLTVRKSNNMSATNLTEIHNDWRLKKLLGQGSYGEVHQAEEIKTGCKVAIKLDLRSSTELEREIEYLKLLNGQSQRIPNILEYGKYSGVNYCVLTLLGKNISELRRRRLTKKFSLSTTIRVGRQIFQSLKDVHDKRLIHRDVKPANFAIGRTNKKKIYVFDFGLSSELHDGTERENVGFRGTNTYASIRVHEHRDPGPADDLWSAFYCILRILGVKFPWDKIKIPPKVERLGDKSIIQCYNQLVQETGESDPVDASGKVPKSTMEARLKKQRRAVQEKFYECKKGTDMDMLLDSCEKKFKLPAEPMKKLVTHFNELEWNEMPNYELIDKIFEKTLKRLKISMDDPYDWE